MKPRKVIVTIEAKTDCSIKDLRCWKGAHIGMVYLPGAVIVVDQIQVNVVKP